jgi:hypothetical protein
VGAVWSRFLAGRLEARWALVWLLVVLDAWLEQHGIEW